LWIILLLPTVGDESGNVAVTSHPRAGAPPIKYLRRLPVAAVAFGW
jgi:hypothetical protein